MRSLLNQVKDLVGELRVGERESLGVGSVGHCCCDYGDLTARITGLLEEKKLLEEDKGGCRMETPNLNNLKESQTVANL